MFGFKFSYILPLFAVLLTLGWKEYKQSPLMAEQKKPGRVWADGPLQMVGTPMWETKKVSRALI